MSCTTCHAPFPRLKPFGEEFGEASPMPPGEEPARAELDLGDPLLQLPRELPLAIRFDGFATLQGNPSRRPTDLQAPWVVGASWPAARSPRAWRCTATTSWSRARPASSRTCTSELSGPFGLPVDILLGQFQLCNPIAKRELRTRAARLRNPEDARGRLARQYHLRPGRWRSPAGSARISAVATVTNGNGIGEPVGDGFEPLDVLAAGEPQPSILFRCSNELPEGGHAR